MARHRLLGEDDVLSFYNPDSAKLGEELYPNLPISDYIKFQENKYEETICLMRDMILTFKLDSEVFKEFECPDGIQKDKRGHHLHLMVLFDHIAVAHYTKFIEIPQAVDVWVMKEYGMKEFWVKQYVIGRHVIRHLFFSWKNGSVMAEITKSRKGRLASCAITTDEMECYGEMEEVFDVHGDDEDFYSLRDLIFKESLISLA